MLAIRKEGRQEQKRFSTGCSREVARFSHSGGGGCCSCWLLLLLHALLSISFHRALGAAAVGDIDIGGTATGDGACAAGNW